MGVHGLWPLLEPVGRRVNIEALTNKRLAIDASIWVHQFIKTMRAADGDVLRNAHLLGFFRRICKLLFNHIHPVFVFDGGTPALKRRTTIARRRAREVQGAKLRKVAERLLLARLRQHALDTVQKEEDSSRADRNNPADVKQRKDRIDQPREGAKNLKAMDAPVQILEQAKEAAVEAMPVKADNEEEGAEEFWRSDLEDEGDVDLAEMHMQQAIEASMRPDDGYKSLENEILGIGQPAPRAFKRRKTGYHDEPKPIQQTRVKDVNKRIVKEEMSDDDGTFVIDGTMEQIDPAVLSNLPQSLQLEVISKLRERKVQANREAFQKRQAEPKSFSDFQLEEYLKASQMRKQMDNIRGEMNAAVTGQGSTAKRIAGEASREYVFSKDKKLPSSKDDIKQQIAQFDRSRNDRKPSTLGSSGLANGSRIRTRPSDSTASQEFGRFKASSELHASGSSSILPSSMGLDELGQGAALNISLDMDASPKQAQTESGDEWEDVDGDTFPLPGSQSLGSQGGTGAAISLVPSDLKKPAHWRERMAQRQKFWSHATGFKMGRKLADWGKEKDHPSEGSLPNTHSAIHLDEQDQIQQAIALSLVDPGPQEGSDGMPEQRRAVSDPLLAGAPSEPLQIHNSDSDSDDNDDKIKEAIALSLADTGLPEGSGGMPGQAGVLSDPLLAGTPSEPLQIDSNDSDSDDNSDKVKEAIALSLQQPLAPAAGKIAPQSGGMAKPKSAEGIAKPFEQDMEARAKASDAIDTEQRSPDPNSTGHKRVCHEPKQLTSPFKSPKVQTGSNPHFDKSREACHPKSASLNAQDDLSTTLSVVNTRRKVASPHDATDTKQEQLTASDMIVPNRHTNASQQKSADGEQTKKPERLGGGEALVPKGTGGPSVFEARQIPFPQQIASAPQTQSQANKDPVPPQKQFQSNRGEPTHASSMDTIRETSDSANRVQWAENNVDEDNDDSFELVPIPDSTILDPHPEVNATNPQVLISIDDGKTDEIELEPLSNEVAGHEPSGRLASEIEAHALQTKTLAKEHRKQAGISDNPTSAMYGECQELLQMFGIPYIIAPVEAEAQCAWLDEMGLVDGVVTDDNDVFLFGGRHIYRHIFADKLYVEEYNAADFETELGLDRQKLIHLALLLGSDYTDGIAGIGIVNAVEIVNHFGTVDQLKLFKEWVMTPDKQMLAAAQKVSKRGKTSKEKAEEIAAEPSGDKEESHMDLDIFKREHQGLRKNWNIPNDFPNARVIQAYREAKVDGNKDAVAFARPDMQHLSIFCLEKFGWDIQKTEDLLQPILKAYDEKQTQATMDSFLTYRQRFAKIKSKRLQKAVKALRKRSSGDGPSNDALGGLAAADVPKPKRKPKKRATAAQKEGIETEGEHTADEENVSKKRKPTQKQRKSAKS